MVKCAKCAKLLNKKAPGLQCNKCNKWLHAECAAISTDKLSAIHSTDSVDWKCKSCASATKTGRISCIMPEDYGEEITDTESCSNYLGTDLTTNRILREIRSEVKEVIRQELQRTLQFYSDKIDEYEKKMLSYDKQVKNLENQCSDLRNNIRNANLKNEVLENKLNSLEQSHLANQLEICGIKEQENEKVEEIVQKVAVAIKQNTDDIVKAYRKKTRSFAAKKVKHSAIIVVLREGVRSSWLEAAKTIPGISLNLDNNGKVYIRESLTSATAFLLWKTKDELKQIYKYIWCKNGNILIRKEEKDKILTIRSVRDIENAKSFHI